jgi:hypothetical protein
LWTASVPIPKFVAFCGAPFRDVANPRLYELERGISIDAPFGVLADQVVLSLTETPARANAFAHRGVAVV